jgi:hypothetical protein
MVVIPLLLIIQVCAAFQWFSLKQPFRQKMRANMQPFESRNEGLSSETVHDLWVVGAGTLGESICRQYKQQHPHASVVGETATPNRHDRMNSFGVIPRLRASRTVEDETSAKNVVVSLPPSSSSDYPGAIRDAMTVWRGPSGGGSLIFTSSLAVYGDLREDIIHEWSRVDTQSPRAMNLIAAEDVVLANHGTVVRLAGLYTKDRGPHTYWFRMEKDGKPVETNSNGIVNMIHYEDAASFVVASLNASVKRMVLMAVDDKTVTKKEICEAALSSGLFPGAKMPQVSAVYMAGE